MEVHARLFVRAGADRVPSIGRVVWGSEPDGDADDAGPAADSDPADAPRPGPPAPQPGPLAPFTPVGPSRLMLLGALP